MTRILVTLATSVAALALAGTAAAGWYKCEIAPPPLLLAAGPAPAPPGNVFRCDNADQPNPSVYATFGTDGRPYGPAVTFQRPFAVKNAALRTQIGNGYGLTCSHLLHATGAWVDSIGQAIPSTDSGELGSYPVGA